MAKNFMWMYYIMHFDETFNLLSGYQEQFFKIMKEESGKSNMKQIWLMEQIVNPFQNDIRHLFEKKASQSKAIWVPVIASFGN